jgi:SecD/SecF fusion protein
MRKDKTRGDEPYFPITDGDLAKTTGDSALSANVGDAVGGVAIVLENIAPPQTVTQMEKRLRDMRLQPGYAGLGWRQQKVIGLTPSGADASAPTYSRAAVVVSDENYLYEEGGENVAMWRTELAEPEVRLARDALERQTSLGKVTQFAPQVAAESKTRAYVALAFSWLMIVGYLWFRFGSITWGMAAVAALIHDAVVALGFVAGAYLLASTFVGRTLLVEAFRIDLAIVAALLTVVGYSVNDTIVVFDRIRENRGKLKEITPQLVNDSINQTMSRTILTVMTVLITIIIMYFWGGRAIHGFNFVMLIGVLTGCYSSIAVASPILVGLQRRAARAVA